MKKSIYDTEIFRVSSDSRLKVNDIVVVEEPLEIRVSYHVDHGIYKTISLAVTMRTPGDDEALVRGFLFTESIISSQKDIEGIVSPELNILLVRLKAEVSFDAEALRRNFYTTSSCGVCGKASIDSIHSDTFYLPWTSKFEISKNILMNLPAQLRESQSLFAKTGGIHGCALVDKHGSIVDVKEDVGRHNAMDKLIGGSLEYPISNHLVLVSGRASFELVQKASKVGIPLMASIGAPSSLAIQLAKEQGMALVGFLKSGGFNIYCGEERVV